MVSEASFPPAEPGVASHEIYVSATPPPTRPPGVGSLTTIVTPPPGGVHWLAVRFTPNQEAGNHHTDTVDFDTILEGSIELILDDGPHWLTAGDCVVVTGVDHSWRAGAQGCVFSVMGLGTPPPD